MRLLVTGGAGYVGSHTCKALAAAGHEVIVFDNLSRGFAWAVRWGELEVGDLRDAHRLDQLLSHLQPDAVLHFAALAYVDESARNPELYVDNNVIGSYRLLEAMRKANVRKLIFSSTCAVYGNPTTEYLDETHPCAPLSAYGQTKLMIEQMLNNYCAAHRFRAVALRYFNAAGADFDGEIGEAHAPETHLIPLILNAGQPDAAPLRIYGEDYPTPDGSCVRDYVHVDDLAQAHQLALARVHTVDGFAVFNLGYGRGHSVKEVISAAEAIIGRKIPVISEPRRAGDAARLVADAQRARRELGWRPRYESLSVILESAWKWAQSRRPD